MWLKWLPWRYVVSRVARARGFIDPISLLNRLHGFAQPSEVQQPTELLRAGVVMHARGLLNTQAIQHNLDWVWPFWVERQFDPEDVAFIPRAFSVTHINLTHRNWTALGLVGREPLVLVDPRGLVTPHFDSFSLDFWIFPESGPPIFPSSLEDFKQTLDLESYSLSSELSVSGVKLCSVLRVQEQQGKPSCLLELEAEVNQPARLFVAVRPYNPEGVSFVHDLELKEQGRLWQLNSQFKMLFEEPPESFYVSTYREGDVSNKIAAAKLPEKAGLKLPVAEASYRCDVGLLTAAAGFNLSPGQKRTVRLSLPLEEQGEGSAKAVKLSWQEVQEQCPSLVWPKSNYGFLFAASARTLLLLSPGDIFPGSFTYKRFWFRDAAFMLDALLVSGFTEQVERVLDLFPERQTRKGYFLSQEGEWDANGEALWIMGRYVDLSGKLPKADWLPAIIKGAKWIQEKLLSVPENQLIDGLLPAGFSAEHFGPSDYYYWDNYWSVAGLESAAKMLSRLGQESLASSFRDSASELRAAICRSIEKWQEKSGKTAGEAFACGPYRRLDAAAVGNMSASYPLKIVSPRDSKVWDTLEYLLKQQVRHGGFFQEMTHSGVNAYLTLHLAQLLLRGGDERFLPLLEDIAALASPTGLWPEAIHPKTLGGCMGDGQHGWAAAEWVLMIRNMFVREEGDALLLCSGIKRELCPDAESGETLSFGPTLTSYGEISVELRREPSELVISWRAKWRDKQPKLVLAMLNETPVECPEGAKELRLALPEGSRR